MDSSIGVLIRHGRLRDARSAVLARAARADVANQTQLARAFGVSRFTVYRWARALECRRELHAALHGDGKRGYTRRRGAS